MCRSMRFAAACLQHNSNFLTFLVQDGILFAAGVSVFGRNINICAAWYKSKVKLMQWSDALAVIV